MRTIMKFHVRNVGNTEKVEEKISAHQAEVQKLERFLELKKKIESAQASLAALVFEHDELAKEIGGTRMAPRKRTSDEEVQKCRTEIVSQCVQPMHMNTIIDALSSRYSDSTIRLQVKNLLDKGKLKKLGERGVTVMYLNSSVFNA